MSNKRSVKDDPQAAEQALAEADAAAVQAEETARFAQARVAHLEQRVMTLGVENRQLRRRLAELEQDSEETSL